MLIQKKKFFDYYSVFLSALLVLVTIGKIASENALHNEQNLTIPFVCLFFIILITYRMVANVRYKSSTNKLRFYGSKKMNQVKNLRIIAAGLVVLAVFNGIANAWFTLHFFSILVLAALVMVYSFYYVPYFLAEVREGKLSLTGYDHEVILQKLKLISFAPDKVGFGDGEGNVFWAHNIFFTQKTAEELGAFIASHKPGEVLEIAVNCDR